MGSVSYDVIFSRAYQPLYVSVELVCLIVAVQVFRRIQSNSEGRQKTRRSDGSF